MVSTFSAFYHGRIGHGTHRRDDGHRHRANVRHHYPGALQNNDSVRRYRVALSLRALLAAGMRIGVTDAYIYGDEVTTLQDDPEFANRFALASVGDVNATRLLDGEIDGFIEDIFVATATIRRRGLEEQIEVHPLQLQSGGEVRFLFSRASVSPELVARFDGALQRVRSSGLYREIQGQYLR